VDRRLALLAVWALFAAAAVGVGFGAAGLVGDPFTDGEVGTATRTTAAPGPSSPAPTTSGAAPSGTASPRTASRSLTTRGGLVTGTCRDGLVRLSAAPAVGWEIDDIDDDAGRDAEVRFERVHDGEGRVEVHGRCVGGVPLFTTTDDSSGSGGSGGSGSGDSGDD
jgi:hypothetical protein